MVDLHAQTGISQIDRLITGIVEIIEAAFPQRVRGYYLVGSYSDEVSVARSDLDLEILFKDALSPQENQRITALKSGIRTIAPLHIDLGIKDEASLSQSDTVALKLASRFLYGTDTRDTIPLPATDVYLHNISGPTHRGLTQRFRSSPVTMPLVYPDPNDEFYGYVPERWRGIHGDIKMWVLHVGWLATFLIVYHAGVHIASKKRMLALYRKHSADEWLPFVESVSQNGRERWGYDLPINPEDRALLRTLCQQTLAFENHVAQEYLTYLKKEHDSGDSAFASERLKDFVLTNEGGSAES